MSLASSTVQAIASEPSTSNSARDAAMVAALVLTVYAAQKSRKQLRRLKRRAILTFFKLKLKDTVRGFFSKGRIEGISTRTLLYILLGLLVLILLLTLPPIVAVVVLIIGIILLLLYKF